MARADLRRAVFLDRDGTLIDELGYLGDPEGVRLFAGAGDAVRRLNEADFAVVLVTNQSGVARGFFSEAQLGLVHARIEDELAQAGARLDRIFYCPHHPTVGEPPYRRFCDCRKPRAGLFRQARDELGLDLSRSLAVGDSTRDLEAARRAGVKERLLVATGKGEETHAAAAEDERSTYRFVADLAEAVDTILAS